MPKKATEKTAKFNTVCCICKQMIFKGDTIKVYNDVWMHVPCWKRYAQSLIDHKKLCRPPNGDLWDKKWR